MAKLFKETTFAKFKAEVTHEPNKIYFIKDKGMMFANGTLYLITQQILLQQVVW